MKNNMGTFDKVLRILVALVIVILYYKNQLSGTTTLVLLVIAGIFILTSFIGYCPIYHALGISTNKNKQ